MPVQNHGIIEPLGLDAQASTKHRKESKTEICTKGHGPFKCSAMAEIIGLGTILANPFIIALALVTMCRAAWAVCSSAHAE